MLLGGFFIVNLFLPVIFLEYESARERVALSLSVAADPQAIDSDRSPSRSTSPTGSRAHAVKCIRLEGHDSRLGERHARVRLRLRLRQL